MRATVAALIVGACAATALLAAQPPPPTFRGGIEVVQADAIVVDADGRQVRGLTAADFTVLVDGQPRAIESVDYISESSADAPTAAPPPTQSPDRIVAGARHVVFVVDQGNIAAGGGRAAITAAGRLLDRFGPRDRLALLSIPSGPSIDFTSEREPIRAAFSRIVGRAASGAADDFRLSLTDLFAFDIGATPGDRADQQAVLLRECPPAMGPRQELCVDSLRADAQSRLSAIRERTQDSLTTLTRLVDTLGKVPGPKVVVLVSEGLILRPDHRDDAGITSLAARAALAGVKVFVMLLDRQPIDIADAGGRERSPSPSLSQDESIQERGLRALAAGSGGVLIRIFSARDEATERLARVLSAYYVIGFRVLPTDREGPHTIKIAPANRALTVISRGQFLVSAAPRRSTTSEPKPLGERASKRREAYSSINIDKIRLRVATHSASDGNGTVRVLLSVDVDDPSPRPVTALALGCKLVDGDRVIADAGRVVPVTRSPDGGALPISYVAFRNIPPGRYSLQLSASDGTKHSGFVAHAVDATLHPFGPYRMSDLLLAASAANSEGAFAVPADVVVGNQLVAGLEVSAADRSALADTAVRFEVARADGSAMQSTREVSLDAAGSTVQFVRTTLDVSGLAPGSYIARASVISGGVVLGRIDAPLRVAR